MAKFGGNNPFPLELGGGKSTSEQIYSLLKDAVGKGGSAEDGTIEAQWRMAQARGIRALRSVQRAVNQNFPNLATDLLPDWEKLYLLAPGNLNDEERRQIIADRYARQIEANAPGLEEKLKEIDPLFGIKPDSISAATNTIPGRAFQDVTPSDPLASGPAFGGGREYTNYPNYSDTMICYVHYDIPDGIPSPEQLSKIARAADVLNEVLPCWVDFQFTYGSAGFYLDIDRLDQGSFD